MNRLAVRLGAVAALQGGGANFPTLAGARVYDSLRDDVADLPPEKFLPVIMVRTDRDERSNILPGGQCSRALEMRIEFGLMTGAKDNDGAVLVGWPETDSELESFLDLLEWQIECALLGNTEWSTWFRGLWMPSGWVSTPIWTEPNEGRVRLAAREIVVSFGQFNADFVPPARKIGDPAYTPALPAPLLEVFTKIANDGAGELKDYVAEIKTKLEEQSLPAASQFPPLLQMRASIFTSVPPPTGEEPPVDITAELLDTV